MIRETAIGGDARGFPSTRWTVVQSSRERPEVRRAALAELLPLYWKPLYFLARHKGRSIEDAKDAVQGFMTSLLDRDFLEVLDPAKGRFRSYLRSAFENFLINEHEKGSALKRGGGARVVSLDVDVAERERPASGDGFDRAWATAVMARALERLRGEFASGARKGPVELLGEFFGAAEPPAYADAAARHGMTVAQLKAFLHRARGRYRELVRDEVRHTVAGDEESELSLLLQAMRS